MDSYADTGRRKFIHEFWAAPVTALSGDDRYLQFYYSGNLIERVDLLLPDGAGTELLKKVEYSYGPYKTGQGTPYNQPAFCGD